MNKPFRLSASSIKTYIWSKSKWAGQYILGVKDSYDSKDALLLGKMFEERLFTGIDSWGICDGVEIYDKEKFIESYDNLKHNSIWLKFEKWEHDVKIEGEMFGYPIIWYLDNLLPDCIDDIKTAQYLSKKEWTKNFWSGMSYYEEYSLQLWIYMKIKGINKSRILEVGKFRYKDNRHSNQIIEFELTEEFDKMMTDKYEPIVKNMFELYSKFNK